VPRGWDYQLLARLVCSICRAGRGGEVLHVEAVIRPNLFIPCVMVVNVDPGGVGRL